MVRKPRSSYLTGKPIVPIVFFHMKKNDHPLNYIWRKTLTRHLISMEEDSYYYAARPSLVWPELISIRQADVDRLMIRTQSKVRVRVRVRLGLGLGLFPYIFKSNHSLSANPGLCRG